MKLFYCNKSDTIREETGNTMVAENVNGRFLLDIDGKIPLGFVVRLVKVWHCLYRVCDAVKLVDALNNIMQGKSVIHIDGENAPLFVETGFNFEGLESFLKRKNCIQRDYAKFSVFYDIQLNHLRVWLDDLHQFDIPITIAD